MFPPNGPQFPVQARNGVPQDVPAISQFNPNASPANEGSQNSNGVLPSTDSLTKETNKREEELKKVGGRIKHHEDRIKLLKNVRNQLEESILDFQVKLGKYLSSGAPRTENEGPPHAQQEEDTADLIIRHEKSAAGALCQLKVLHSPQTFNLPCIKDVVGIVALLGTVDDDNVSCILSEYLGLDTMLAIVCKTNDGVKALEVYDNEGNVDKISGIHGLGATMRRTIEGRFITISLESLRPYPGEFVSDDPQKRLNIPKPRLPTGESPQGFLGEEAAVRFPRSSNRSHLLDGYSELQKQIKEKQWEKERLQEDVHREETLLEQAKREFKIKKDDFLVFLAQSSGPSSYLGQQQMQGAAHFPR